MSLLVQCYRPMFFVTNGAGDDFTVIADNAELVRKLIETRGGEERAKSYTITDFSELPKKPDISKCEVIISEVKDYETMMVAHKYLEDIANF